MWQLEPLRDHLRSMDREHRLIGVVDSIGRASDIFNFHLFSARDALKDIIDEEEPTGVANVRLILGVSERQDDYKLARLASEAHLIACLHTVRNEFDIFAQLINGLLLSEPLSVSKCDILRVHDLMSPSVLQERMSRLLTSYWYRYIAGFINTAKHRKLVKHAFSVSFRDNAAGVKVGAFEYGGRNYPECWGVDVLRGAVEAHNALVSCGCALNDHCGVQNDA